MKLKTKLLVLLLLTTSFVMEAQNLQKGDYGYLYCHMSGRGEWTAYAISRDGVNYHDLLNGDSILVRMSWLVLRAAHATLSSVVAMMTKDI